MIDFLYTIFIDVIPKSFNINRYSMRNFYPASNGLALTADTKDLPQSLRDDIRFLLNPFVGDIKDAEVYAVHLRIQSEISELNLESDCEVYCLDIICNDHLGYDIERQGGTIVNKGNAILFKASNRYWNCFHLDDDDYVIDVLRYVIFVK